MLWMSCDKEIDKSNTHHTTPHERNTHRASPSSSSSSLCFPPSPITFSSRALRTGIPGINQQHNSNIRYATSKTPNTTKPHTQTLKLWLWACFLCEEGLCAFTCLRLRELSSFANLCSNTCTHTHAHTHAHTLTTHTLTEQDSWKLCVVALFVRFFFVCVFAANLGKFSVTPVTFLQLRIPSGFSKWALCASLGVSIILLL